MPDFLATAYKAPSVNYQVHQFNGTTIKALGGIVDRITVAAGAASRQESNKSASSFARAYTWRGGEIYLYNALAFYVPISAIGASFLTYTKGDTWSTPSASGTFAEAGQVGDTEIKVEITSGSIVATETITIGSGPASGQTATADATETQRGTLGSEGEWVVQFPLSVVPFTTDDEMSGLVPMTVDGREQIVGLYEGLAGDFYGFVIDPVANTITETGSLGGAGASFGTGGGGNAQAIADSLVWVYAHATGGRYQTIVWNPTTDSIGAQVSTSIGTLTDQAESHGYVPILWRGRLLVWQTDSTLQSGVLLELVAGGWAELLVFDGSNGAGDADFTPPNSNIGSCGCMMLDHGDKLFMVVFCDNNLFNGYNVIALSDNDGVIQCDNMRTGTGNVILSADSPHKLGQFLLAGSGLASGISPSLTGNPKLRYMRDTVTNGFGGQDRWELWFIDDNTGGVADIKRWAGPFVALGGGVTIDWSTAVATAGDTFEVDTNIDPTGQIAVDDWVVDPDGQIFRVSAVNAGTPSIDIENPNKAIVTIQGSGSSDRKLVAFTSPGVSGAIPVLAMPTESQGGGGRVFTKNQKVATIVGTLGVLNNDQVNFKANGGGVVDIKAFHGEDPDEEIDQESTIGAGSVTGGGGLSGNTITSHPADGTTVGTFEHEIATDGVVNGDTLRRALEIQ